MPRYFPLVSKRTVIVEVPVEVPVGDGDRDVSYIDSFDISEQLAGTLGPVQTQDSIDVFDTFVGEGLVLQDSFDTQDEFTPIDGPEFQDSVDVADRLSGTIGPIAAPDTFDTTDDSVFGPLVLADSLLTLDEFTPIDGPQLLDSVGVADQLAGMLGPVIAPDSFDVSDDLVIGPLVVADSMDVQVTAEVDLSASALDSFDIQARIGQITRFDFEQFVVGDQYGDQRVELFDSFDASDFLDTGPLLVADSLDVAVIAEATITARQPESLAVADLLMADQLDIPDSFSIADQRGNANVSNARLWPNAVVSNTGFTNPNNTIDLSETTAAQISATQSGGLLGGNSATVNGNIQISAPNIAFSPDATLNSVQIQAGWTTTSSGGLQNGNSVNVAIEYSLNEGGAWTLLERVTNDAGTGNPVANITASTAQLNQLRFRAVGSVVSGTTLLTGGANQTFQFRYARVQFNAVQVL